MAEEGSTSFSLFKLEGKPIEKLIETVSAGIGVLYKPRAMRKEADAKAYEVGVLAEANAKASIITADAEGEIAERARLRLYYQEMQRQVNLDNIVQNSTLHLNETVSEEPVDEDWRTRFFNKAQDVTSEELQEIWGKILANEINQPGTISIRSLEIFSNLSKKEAELLTVFGSMCCQGSRVLKMGGSDLEKHGLKFGDLLILRSANLLYESDSLKAIFPIVSIVSEKKPNGTIITFGDIKTVVHATNGVEVSFNQLLLTPAGVEIINVINCEPNYEYWQDFQAYHAINGYTFSLLIDFLSNEVSE